MSRQENVQVVVRVRPMVGREKLRGSGKNSCRSVVTAFPDEGMIQISDLVDPMMSLEDGKKTPKKKGKKYKKLAKDGEDREEDRNLQERAKIRNIKSKYDLVFGPESSQEQVFFEAVRESVEAVTNGINCSVFAYGQTGTGKTYTILGEEYRVPNVKKDHGAGRNNNDSENDDDDNEAEHDENEKKGMIPRAVEYLFELLAKRSQSEDSDDDESSLSSDSSDDDDDDAKARKKTRIISSTVYCSFLQIYNEKLFDLLQDHRREFPLKIRSGQNGSNFVRGLSEIRVSNMQDVYDLVKVGSQNRAIRETLYNQASSRSHAVLQLRVETEEQTGGISESRVIRSAKFSFVDLAGSEKWDTRSKMCTDRQKELVRINMSLSSLGKVIHALSEKDRVHIPYRDSSLTYLLQDSLGGNTKTTIICTLSPVADCIEESISTLQFADRALRVVSRVKVNEVIDDSVLLAHAQAEIIRLRRELKKKNGKSKMPKAHKELRREVAYLREENARYKDYIEKLQETQNIPKEFFQVAQGDRHLDFSSSDESDDDENVNAEVESCCKPEEEEEGEKHMGKHAKKVSSNQHEESIEQGSDGDALDLIQPVSEYAADKYVKPAPSDIVSALKDDLQNQNQKAAKTKKKRKLVPKRSNPYSEGREDVKQKLHQQEQQKEQEVKQLEEMEEKCLKELDFEFRQLQTLQLEREKLEEAMRILKHKARTRHKDLVRSNEDTKTKRKVRKKKMSKKTTTNMNVSKVPPKSVGEPSRKLKFSPKDVGVGLSIYQCRVDAWFNVDITSYDPKSGMHLVRYRDDGSKHWHQLEGRKYVFIEASTDGKVDGVKSLLREASKAEAERQEQKRVQNAMKKSKSISKSLEAYGGLQALWGSSSSVKPQLQKTLSVPRLLIESGEREEEEQSILDQLKSEGLSY